MDVLSDVLGTVRLQGSIHFCPELSAPWGFQVLGQPDRVPFYVLSRGSCYLELDGEPPVPLAGGDVVMLPHGAAHILRDRLQTPAIPLDDLLRHDGTCTAARATPGTRPRVGGGGGKSALVSGYFQFEGRAAHPLLQPLPSLVHVRPVEEQSVPWLEATLRFLAAESTSAVPGAQIVTARLTDILFVQILRAYIAQADPHGEACQRQAGILRALVDPQISQALGLMHQQLDHPWTVAELAQRVSMSRTSFAVRFAALAGVTPLDYLRQWRMQKAGDLLLHGEESLDAIAKRVGYGSGAAFSKAFKDEMGRSPGLYRREPGTRAADDGSVDRGTAV